MDTTATDSMTRDEIYAWIAETIHEMFDIDRALITMQADLYDDLDIDSIDAVDLAVKLKEFTGKRLQPETFKAVRTVGDVVQAVLGLLAE